MSTDNKTMIKKEFFRNIKSNIDNLYQISKEKKWEWDYDEVSDILCFCNKKIGYSEQSINMAINEDYLTIQINQKGDIEGIIIEDFVKLFVPENLEYAEFAKNLTSKGKIEDDRSNTMQNSAKGFRKMLATDFRNKYLIPVEKCCVPA